MIKFLKHTLIFLILLLMVNWTLKIILNNIYFKEYQEVDLNSEIYILADSHGDALGEFRKDNIYNFSAPSDSYLDMRIKLEYLIKHSKISTLIITVDNHTLSPYREESNNKDRSAYFTSSSNYPNYFDFVANKFLYPNLVILSPQYGTLIKRYILSLTRGENSNSSWLNKTEKERKTASLKRFEKQFEFEQNSPILREELMRILKLSKQNNLKLIGLKFPVSKDYDELQQTKNYGSDRIFRDRNIPVIEFEDFNINNITFFKDQDHLSKKGADIFKQELLDLFK
jgi:hypothetical protein